jgi:hypothetical protein
MQIVKLKLAELAPNTGQIPGLPINPRQWTKGDVDKIAASLKETPELFEARPVLVIPHDGKYVILGGNLRYEGARANKEKEVPAIIFPEDTPVEKLKEVVIKDNGAFGAWDYDALANEWDDLPLGDWGVPAWTPADDLPPIDDKDALGDQYSQNVGQVVYEPKETHHKVADLYANNGVKFDEMIDELKDEELKKMLRLRAAWFTDFNFAKVADYYAYQATPEEQRVFEALGLVLLDRDQLIANGFSKLVEDFEDEENH